MDGQIYHSSQCRNNFPQTSQQKHKETHHGKQQLPYGQPFEAVKMFKMSQLHFQQHLLKPSFGLLWIIASPASRLPRPDSWRIGGCFNCIPYTLLGQKAVEKNQAVTFNIHHQQSSAYPHSESYRFVEFLRRKEKTPCQWLFRLNFCNIPLEVVSCPDHLR